MRYRFTRKECECSSDVWFLIALISERSCGMINVNSPLYKRLKALRKKLENGEDLTRDLPADKE